MHRRTHWRRARGGLALLMLVLVAGASSAPTWGFRIGWSTPTESFVEAWDVEAAHADERFQSDGELRVQLIDTNLPANLARPGEQAELTFQFQNLTGEPMPVRGVFDVFKQRAFNEEPGSLGVTGLRRTRDVARIPFELEIPAEGFKNVRLDPELPERFGGYVVIADVDGRGRFFGAALARIHEVHLPEGVQFRRYTMDSNDIDQLKRLAAYPNRIGMTYKTTTDEDFDQWWETYHNMRLLRRIGEAGMTTTVEFGHGVQWHAPYQPLGRPRPLLQYVDDKPIITTYYPADMAWKPAYDEDWEEFVYKLCVEYGYPHGPINGVMLWNEPWEGSSIAGWGADMLRYRDMYRHMAKGVERAREDAGVDVRIGGNDSMSNTFDKFFSDGSTEFLQWLDFMSVHYQGNTSGSTIRLFRQREHANGRTEIWDTESWAANTEEGVAALIAAKASFGYDRIVGIYGGGTMDRLEVDVQGANGETERRSLPAAWPINAAIAASQKFVGERAFSKLLFDNGLPWIIVFEGEDGDRDDGTAVIVGDLGPAFQDEVPAFPFWMVRALAEAEDKRRAREQLDALPDDAPAEQREALKDVLESFQHLRDARMIIDDPQRRFAAYGTYGNELEHDGERLIVPLSGEGVYVRVRDGQASFDELLEALRAARIEGYQPIAVVARDMLERIEDQPTLRLELTNVLNRPIEAELELSLGELAVDHPGTIGLEPHETREVAVQVTSGEADPSNIYPLSLRLDAGADGWVEHEEAMRVNVIERRTITVDGSLEDWEGVLPQPVEQEAAADLTLEQEAWFPHEAMPERLEEGFATAYLAYDDDYFYFAARIADTTPHPGGVRFETRDDDEYFYPETVYIQLDERGQPVADADPEQLEALTWPEGVRRYSYRKHPDLPAGHAQGTALDNVQLAFNVVPPGDPQGHLGLWAWDAYPENTRPNYTRGPCTDHEYALNNVAEEHGGGTEIWRLRYPGMPPKHFYPRQPESPYDGAVHEGQLVIRHEDNTRMVEAAIPWSEIPQVRQRLDAGETIKFSYRVNDDAGVGTMELARQRSVSRWGYAFQVDWARSWANEVEFRFEP